MLDVIMMVPMMLAEAAPVAVETAQQSAGVYDLIAKSIGILGGVLGAGLIVIGAARGIGNLAGSAVEAIARQPEAGGRIFTTMIIAAALIEGVTLFALIICLLAIIGN